MVALDGISPVAIDGQIAVGRSAVGHNLAGGGNVVGDDFNGGIGAVGSSRGIVRTHMDGVRRIWHQADEGVARAVGLGPLLHLAAVNHTGHHPGGLVGELLDVTFPFDGDSGMGDVGGEDVGYGRHGFESLEAGAHPRREVIAAADVLYIYIIGSGILQTGEDDALRVEAGAGGSHAVQLFVGQVGRGAKDIVEVVGLVGLGLLPADGGAVLAGDFGDHVAHCAAGAEGAEAGVLPCALALVVAIGVADGVDEDGVFGVGVKVVEADGVGCTVGPGTAEYDILGVEDRVTDNNPNVVGNGALDKDNPVAAHIVARRSSPADGGAALSDVAHHDLGNRRAGIGLHTVLERNFR